MKEDLIKNKAKYVVFDRLFDENEDSLSTEKTTIPVEMIKHSRITLGGIVKTFFESCLISGVKAINANIVPLEDFENMEPYIFLGLPSLVVGTCLFRSIGIDGLILFDGSLLT